MGIEGFKLDYGEDVVPGLAGARNVWRFADGSDERTMHARFQRFYHRVYAETLPDDGGFLLCRPGTCGDQTQRLASSGPATSTRASPSTASGRRQDGETYIAVGGLPAAVDRRRSRLGPRGFPFFGADTGGYRHSPAGQGDLHPLVRADRALDR